MRTLETSMRDDLYAISSFLFPAFCVVAVEDGVMMKLGGLKEGST